MSRMLFVALLGLVVSCGTLPPRREGAAQSMAPQDRGDAVSSTATVAADVAMPASVGSQALADIQGWYNDVAVNCNASVNQPAVLCSGVMLRATEPTPSFLPWDPSSNSITSGGISFSYIRNDVNFTKLAYGHKNGFILYPKNKAPGSDLSIEVLCSFPMDASTSDRKDQGCGQHPLYAVPARTEACDKQGLNTLAAWQAFYAQIGNDDHRGQCGWGVRKGENGTAARFILSLQAHEVMTGYHRNTQNELRLATWPTGSGASLPIRAFFYLTGGLSDAQDDQRRYYQQFGVFVPVVRVNLPAVVGGKATFAYVTGEQVIADGAGEVFEHFEGEHRGEFTTLRVRGGMIENANRPVGSTEIVDVVNAWNHVNHRAVLLRNGANSKVTMKMTLASPALEVSFGYAYQDAISPTVMAWYSDNTTQSWGFKPAPKDGRESFKAKPGTRITAFSVRVEAVAASKLYIDNIALTGVVGPGDVSGTTEPEP
ncbi:hypothetical protein [Luteibacter anthropi]|uniref:Halovibrin HvnA n=1 Tax=Luteibacter anthropi TaxID=564369 RepID=A0A7X5ZIL3_9GAMM|nr:hypothetical protein [Luteibacter anthropi]NII07023.1 hypothetical protein [Luteibacter anthropi]